MISRGLVTTDTPMAAAASAVFDAEDPLRNRMGWEADPAVGGERGPGMAVVSEDCWNGDNTPVLLREDVGA